MCKRLIIAAAIAAASSCSLRAETLGCLAGLDRLNYVRESMRPESSKTELEDYLSMLVKATEQCRHIADLWHYRAMIESRLGLDSKFAKAQLTKPSVAYLAARPADTAPVPVVQRPPVSGKVREKWAVVVGISKFGKNPTLNLNYAAADAEAVAKLLTDPGVGRFKPSNVVTLLDEQATTAAIRTAIGDLRGKAQPEDLVFLYLSTHGSPRDMDPRGASFLITHDTDVSDQSKIYGTSLQMIDLVQQLNRELTAARLVLVLDTCHSGDAASSGEGQRSRSLKPAPPDPGAGSALAQLEMGSGRAILAASQATQQSHETSALGHGLFTYYLLEAMRQDKGLWTLDKIFEYVSTRTAEAASKLKPPQQQEPLLKKDGQAGSLVIGVEVGQSTARIVKQPAERYARNRR